MYVFIPGIFANKLPYMSNTWIIGVVFGKN
jgi:hypothetical protein